LKRFGGFARVERATKCTGFSHKTFRIGGSAGLRSGANFLAYLFTQKRKMPFARSPFTREAAQVSQEKICEKNRPFCR